MHFLVTVSFVVHIGDGKEEGPKGVSSSLPRLGEVVGKGTLLVKCIFRYLLLNLLYLQMLVVAKLDIVFALLQRLRFGHYGGMVAETDAHKGR